MPLRHDVERHPDPDPFRALGQDRADQQAVRDHLVALVLEVVLGQPERVEAEPVGEHTHVEDLLGRPPHLVLVVPTLGRSRGPGTRIRHLDATEEEDPGTHAAHCTKLTRCECTCQRPPECAPWGVDVPGRRCGRLVEAVVAAEELGLDEVWIADEGVARDPVAVLAAAAMQTTTIKLIVGVTSPVLRHPGAIAASLATLDELSDGRAVLGLGVGGDMSLAPFGLAAERPVALFRDAIQTAPRRFRWR